MLSIVLGLGMLMTAPFAPGGRKQKAFADEGKNTPYTYTVTVYAGNGTIDGKDSASIGGLGYGVDLSMSLDNINSENGATLTVNGHSFAVKAADERHYPKGIRLAGANEADMAVPFDSVTQNQQFVVAYGLTKDRVTYRVDYLDESGKALAESQTFYGNVGDKPVAAFQYIENYVPNAYNITGTLSANEADNVFQFVYKPVDPAAYQILYVNRGNVLNTGPEAAMRAEAEVASGGGNADAGGASPARACPVDRPGRQRDAARIGNWRQRRGFRSGHLRFFVDDGVRVAWPCRAACHSRGDAQEVRQEGQASAVAVGATKSSFSA